MWYWSAILNEGLREVNRIIFSADAGISRYLHVVAGAAQQGDKYRGGAMVVQVQLHNFLSRAISCGESALGLPW